MPWSDDGDPCREDAHLKNAVVFMALVLGAAACERTLPFSGNQPQVVVMDDHSGAFFVWEQNKAAGRTVVHIDAHDDFRPVDPAAIVELQRLLQERRIPEIRKRVDTNDGSELFNLGNYLYAAQQCGMVKEIYWIQRSLPSTGPHRLEWVKEELIAHGYPRDEVQSTFRIENGLITGSVYGVTFTVCALAELPLFKQPVLLDIDVDFFPEALRQEPQATMDQVLGRFQDDLRKTRLRYDIVTIARSLHLNFTPLEYRYVGGLVEQVVRHPGAPLAAKDLQIAGLRSQADWLERAGERKKAMDVHRAILALEPEDAQAFHDTALLRAREGEYEQAFPLAARAAAKEPDFNRGLASMGRMVSNRYDLAMQFIDAAERNAPQASYVREARADIYFNFRRYRKALDEYLGIENKSLGAIMYIGDTYMMLKEYRKAREYYDRGFAIMERSPFYKAETFPDSLLLLGEYYQRIERNPEAAKKYFDRYLRIPRSGPEQEEARREVQRRSRMH